MLPFTHEQFLDVFSRYNAAVFPAQIVAYLLGIAALALVFSPRFGAGRVISAILAAMWLWTGAVYHALFFAMTNRASYVFAIAFVIEAALIAYAGVVQHRLTFARPNSIGSWVGLALIIYAGILYPLIGFAAGNLYPAMPTFGITPCPVTLFSFGMLLLSTRQVPPWVLAIPVLWSVVGGSAALLLQVPQDWVLLVSGLLTAAVLYLERRRRSAPMARIA